MTSRERAEAAADSFFEALKNGGTSLMLLIARAIDEAVAEAVKAEPELREAAKKALLWQHHRDCKPLRECECGLSALIRLVRK